MSMTALVWLLLAAFVCNDGEELLTVESWLRSNVEQARTFPGVGMVKWNKSVTAQFAVAVLVVGSVGLLAAWCGAQSLAETGRLNGLFVAALAVMLLDGVKHILMSLYLRQYSCGVITAALVQVPYSLYAFYRFLGAGVVTWAEILRYGLMGVVLIFPLLWMGFALGRWIVPAKKAGLMAQLDGR